MNSMKPLKYKQEKESAAERAFKSKYDSTLWMMDRMS